MKRYINSLILTLQLIAAFAVPALAAVPVHATGVNVFQGVSCSGGAGASAICGADQQDDFTKLMKNIINTILLVLGMIAVLMIIIGGIRYVTSNGDSSNIQSAKNTIMYAVIGLIVAILAYAIVNFVISKLKGGS